MKTRDKVNGMRLAILRTLIVLLVPVILVLGSVQILATDAYLAFQYGNADFPRDLYGFSPAERFEHARANLAYVRSSQPVDALASQRHGGSPLYNPRELSHMQDVQAVFRAAQIVWAASLGLAAAAGAVLASSTETRPVLRRAISSGGGLTAMLLLGMGLLAVVAWQAWFQMFHQVFFANGTWTFNVTDTLIRLFPEKFWFMAALSVSGVSLVLGGLIWLAGLHRPA